MKPPGAKEIHVWRAHLDAPPDERSDPLPLDFGEFERMGRLRGPLPAARFAASRAFLRTVLGRYLDLPAAAVELTTGRFGKPELRPPSGSSSLFFNLSHSGGLALCAVCRTHRVGVDIEAVAAVPQLEALIARYLASAERARIPAAGRTREEAFLRFWTRKEALLKGVGIGLTEGLAGVSVAEPLRPVLPEGIEGIGEDLREGWRIHDLEPAPGYVGAVAVQGRGMDLVPLDY